MRIIDDLSQKRGVNEVWIFFSSRSSTIFLPSVAALIVYIYMGATENSLVQSTHRFQDNLLSSIGQLTFQSVVVSFIFLSFLLPYIH